MLTNPPESLVILAGNGHPALAEGVARELVTSVGVAKVTAFADGEIHVRISEDVRAAAVVIVQPTPPPVRRVT